VVGGRDQTKEGRTGGARAATTLTFHKHTQKVPTRTAKEPQRGGEHKHNVWARRGEGSEYTQRGRKQNNQRAVGRGGAVLHQRGAPRSGTHKIIYEGGGEGLLNTYPPAGGGEKHKEDRGGEGGETQRRLGLESPGGSR